MHKKTIKKKGRDFGPYYYTNIRLEGGKTRTFYLGTEKRKARKKER